MITSLSCVAPSYIGECMDLQSELRKHNTGYGSEVTRNTALHPWGVYAFVYGFYAGDDNGSNPRALSIEDWRFRVSEDYNLDEVFVVGRDLANEWSGGISGLGFPHILTIVKCGQFSLAAVDRTDETVPD